MVQLNVQRVDRAFLASRVPRRAARVTTCKHGEAAARAYHAGFCNLKDKRNNEQEELWPSTFHWTGLGRGLSIIGMACRVKVVSDTRC